MSYMRTDHIDIHRTRINTYFFTILIDCSLLDAIHAVLLFQLFIKQTYEYERQQQQQQQQQSPRPPPSSYHPSTTGSKSKNYSVEISLLNSLHCLEPAEFVFVSHTINRHAGTILSRWYKIGHPAAPLHLAQHQRPHPQCSTTMIFFLILFSIFLRFFLLMKN